MSFAFDLSSYDDVRENAEAGSTRARRRSYGVRLPAGEAGSVRPFALPRAARHAYACYAVADTVVVRSDPVSVAA
jgi:hypothetical protein